eukprot:scaffold4526_cov87-Cylindrotheca_fusiformis.AAC.1
MDRRVVDERLHSVLSHRLGLPLLYALHGEDVATLEYLEKKTALLTPAKDRRLNGILARAIVEWQIGRIKNNEAQLTKMLVEKINEQLNSFNALHELKVEEVEKPDGHINIICREVESKKDVVESTPFIVIELGLGGICCWWKKLDQGIMYVDRMCAQSMQPTNVRFDKPLLLAVVTFDESGCEGDNTCDFRIGAFLCFRKNAADEYRMSLLWHTKSNALENASNMFGRLLRVAADFQQWRDDGQSIAGYEYFSSNCCRVGQEDDENAVVLRSYDNRFRKTNRSPDVYLSPECRNVVGDVRTIVKIPGEQEQDEAVPDSCDDDEKFWYRSQDRGLLIIAVPYRRGGHVATSPGAFVPIIDQLDKLHKKGFVHGDIRAFNTVFGENKNQGWLIDFDFGGKDGSVVYPEGYRQSLVDGDRIVTAPDGGANAMTSKKKIFKFHD